MVVNGANSGLIWILVIFTGTQFNSLPCAVLFGNRIICIPRFLWTEFMSPNARGGCRSRRRYGRNFLVPTSATAD